MALTMEKDNKNVNVNAKMGMWGWLTIIFVVLKLDPGNHLSSPVEDWSWWLVFIVPLTGAAFLALIGIAAAILFGGAATIDAINRARSRRRQKKIAAMTPEERSAYYRKMREKKHGPTKASTLISRYK